MPAYGRWDLTRFLKGQRKSKSDSSVIQALP